MFEFVDDSFIKEKSFENILSIQVGLNGFSFCIRGKENNHLLYFKQFPVKTSSDHLFIRRLEDWCKEDELLQLPYYEKQVFYIGHRFSLVPEQLEHEELKSNVRSLIMSAHNEDEYAENWIEEIKAKLVYILPDRLHKVLNENLGSFKLKHIVQKLISSPVPESAKNNFLLFFDEKELIILARKEAQLVLCNIFKVNHVNDVIYYMLTLVKQLPIDSKNCLVQVSGKSDFMEGSVNSLSKHFNSIERFPQNTDARLNQVAVSESVCLF